MSIATRTRFRNACLAALVAAPLLSASAGPAPWYKWRSKLDGGTACSQWPLGPGWERAGGPYRDSRCEKLLLVK